MERKRGERERQTDRQRVKTLGEKAIFLNVNSKKRKKIVLPLKVI